MRLLYDSLGFDGEDEEGFSTEVTFMEHEERTRNRLAEAIRLVGVPYDETVFPERIILIGHYSVKSVHEIMTRQKHPEQLARPIVPGASLGVQVISVSNRYL